jgi:AAT family amino acid transporter
MAVGGTLLLTRKRKMYAGSNRSRFGPRAEMKTETRAFKAIEEREKGLRRSLTRGQLSMIAIGGAIGTGLFLGSGLAIGFAGPSVLVSYAIGALISFLLMGCLAEMTVAHPTSGSFGAWAEFYVHPLAGFLVRYAYWSAIVFAVGTEVTAVAVYMKFWFPAVPGWCWIVVFSAALIAINAVNVKAFGSIEYTFSALKITAIVVFIALGALMVFRSTADSGIGFANYVSHGGFFPKGIWGVWLGLIVSIFSYLGIEMIAIAAGEADDPQRAITGALRATVTRLVVFYLLTLALILAIVPWDANRSGQSPFVRVIAATHVPYASGIVNFVILIAALSAMNSQLYGTTRMMFSLSRAGYAPFRFGRLSRRGTPVAALALSTIGIGVATIVSVLFPDKSFTLMIAISMFGALFSWLMIFVTHLFFRRVHRGQKLAFRMWGHPYGSLLGAGLISAILISTAFARDFRMTLACGIPFLALLTVAYFTALRRE